MAILDLKDLSSQLVTEDSLLAGQPAWHPNGSTIAFTSWGPDGSTIRLLTLADRSIKRLTDPSLRASSPTWSPDGSHMGFIRDEQIYIGRIDSLDAAVAVTSDGDYRSVHWSPSGDRLVARRVNQILTMASDGSGTRVETSGFDVRTPSWSTDACRIVFWSAGKIFTVDVATGGTTLVVSSEYQDDWPSWSPDDNWIVYVHNEPMDGGGIYASSPDGAMSFRLSAFGGSESYPRWAPALSD